MSTRLSQKDFADYTAAWGKFIANAGAAEVQTLFQNPDNKQTQLYVSFDLRATIMPLLSTVGIALVRTRFVLLPADKEHAPHFGVVVYAADDRGGRISAYYLGTSQWEPLDGQLNSCKVLLPAPTLTQHDSTPTPTQNDLTAGGLTPFNLAKTWVCNWAWAAQAGQLGPAMFATSYGLLQGYDFELGDFLDPLFQMQNPKASAVRAIFGLKQYYPAYPEGPSQPTSTFELVVRLHAPAAVAEGGHHPAPVTVLDEVMNPGGGGPSYDQSVPNPPGY